MKAASSGSTSQGERAAEPAGYRPEQLGLRGIAGQPAVVSVLRSALAAGRPHHAYLFDGPAGVGKAATARALFAGMNCEAPPAPGDACGACGSCLKLASGNHPDLIVFDMTLSGLADEAERVIRRIQYPPSEGRAQLVLLDPADQLAAPTAQTAANRLLKSIEEPRARTHFVLVTTAASALLQTIRSRCQRLRFAPLPDAVIADELRRHHGAAGLTDDAQVLKLAQGSLGRALRLMGDPEGLGKRQAGASALYDAASEGSAARICAAASEQGADREEAIETLDLLWLRLHGELRAAIDRGGPDAARSQQAARCVSGLRNVRDAQTAIRRYTSPPLALERLLRHLHTSAPRAASAPARGQGAP